ncbi:YadA-like family protein, partial [Negativicoccus succinicivorans]|uniref:YadA-like family protein n=1 Tax=Negativicoccus succinicivorans TaxID=620903 RepID=UPI0026EB0BF5
DTDAVNVAQLKAVQEIAAAKTTIEAGDNITVAPGATAGSYKISATDTTLKTADNALSLDGSKLNLSVEDTKGNKVTGSVDLKSIQSAVDTNTTYTMTGTENAADNTTTISLKDSNGKEQKVTVATKDTNTYTTGGTYDAENKKLVFTQNDPSKNYEVDVSKMISDVVDTDTRNTIAETDTVAVDATDKNADGSINYKLNVKTDGVIAKDNKGIVTGGTVYNETRIENDGKYIKAENTAGQNLIALDKQVDANTTNITKLENNIYDMGGRIGELGNRVDRVGAGAAALAALHPLDFDPDDKWDFAAGYGNYSGANAVAIGAYYRPNEDTMFSVGGSFGGGENMVNAGVSVKLGQGNNVTTSRVAMAREISDLKSKNEKMQEENKEMRNEIEILKEQMQKLMARK